MALSALTASVLASPLAPSAASSAVADSPDAPSASIDSATTRLAGETTVPAGSSPARTAANPARQVAATTSSVALAPDNATWTRSPWPSSIVGVGVGLPHAASPSVPVSTPATDHRTPHTRIVSPGPRPCAGPVARPAP